MNEGLKILKAEDVTQEWRDLHQPPKTTAELRKDILKKLESSDNKLIRLIEDLTEFCETLGFVTDETKKAIINERKLLREELENL
jgi:hypothetical protein